ncbi:MAG: hypothetical protein EXS36_14515 [Pedosphaera sp.]|nr:hypothetical protein [Pedosphaera sp.]
MKLLLRRLALCLAVLACAKLQWLFPITQAAVIELAPDDRILFLGDTFFEREGVFGHVETRITTTYPDRNLFFRNLAWSAETPMGRARASFDWNKPESEWLQRVKEQVGLVKPTVTLLSYAMTASFDGENGLLKFEENLGQLMAAIDEVSGRPVRHVLIGAIRHESGFGTVEEIARHNDAITRYNQALSEIATKRGGIFVDLAALPNGALKAGTSLTSDGIHLTEDGYRVAAEKIAQALAGSVSPGSTTATLSTRESVLNLAIRKKNELFFHRWRPANWTYLFGFRKGEQGRNSVEMPRFEPLIAEWEKRISRLRDLKEQDATAAEEVHRLAGGEGLAPVATAESTLRKPPSNPQPVPTFQVHEGFEISLWAESPDLFKPIGMNWDAQGRLWVASSRVYPMIKPGQDAEDSIVVLSDTNQDGRADTSTVFADGLLIPTSVLPDNRGGCYAACSHELLHFPDSNGDGKADSRRIVLSSFGTEDTHHNLHTLRWGYDGHLYMNQSIYTHSHVETPHGIVRLNSAGILRFNPDTWQLEIFTKGGCNPWGHHWDQYGNSFFTDGAGSKGIYHAMEGATYFTYSDMRREANSISPGNYPKFCGLETVHSSAFPAEWQGNMITCDFRAQRIVRFGLTEAGSSYQTRELPDLARSTNVTFRPIDVKFGPDGALYIADWSNPIIQHGEVDFRDPRRDHEHGRIWRVAPKGTPSPRPPDLTKLSVYNLLDRTLSKNGWEQAQSRAVLRQRAADDVLPAARSWVSRQTDARAALEALWLHESFGQPAPELLNSLIAARDERLRTAGARQLAR